MAVFGMNLLLAVHRSIFSIHPGFLTYPLTDPENELYLRVDTLAVCSFVV